MRQVRRAAILAVLVVWSSPLVFGQTAAPGAVALTPGEMEAFLLTAQVVRMRPAGDGVTNSRRATMTDGRVTHDAHIQVVDESKAIFDTPRLTELNFKDTYRYNIAGYRLARLLELDNVPMSVERRIEGKSAAVTWWIDDVMMDEGDRQKKKVTDPDARRGSVYVLRHRVFDELIQNRDRNLGNLIYTSEWKMWMIDHTRAFRLGRELLKPAQLTRIEPALFANLKKLTAGTIAAAVGSSLTKQEIEAIVARRDVIVKVFEQRLAKGGEAAVFHALTP